MKQRAFKYLVIFILICWASYDAYTDLWGDHRQPFNREYVEGRIMKKMQNISEILNEIVEECGRYPTAEEGINFIQMNPPTPDWCKVKSGGKSFAKLKRVDLVDYYNTPLKYSYSSKGAPILISASHDRVFGTEDDLKFDLRTEKQPNLNMLIRLLFEKF